MRRGWLVFLVVAVLAPPICSAEPAWSIDVDAEIDAGIRGLINEHEVVGLALGIVVARETVFSRGYGFARIGQDKPVGPDSNFHWASVSKPFVAVGIMQLVQERQLSLDDTLPELLPWFEMDDARYRSITVEQLLTHTAGMPDVDDYEWHSPQTGKDALKRWVMEQKTSSLLFEPGSNRQYSNIGFEVLGMIIQEVTGETFEDAMRNRIFSPAGMDHSSFFASEIDPARRTVGHLGGWIRRPARHYPYNRRHAPSSTLNSNVLDMAKFATRLLDDYRGGASILLDAETIQLMWRVNGTSSGDVPGQFGLGWNTGRPWGDIRSASHGGHDDGFRSLLYIAPDEDIAVFLASNDDTTPVRDFARFVLETLYPAKNPARQ